MLVVCDASPLIFLAKANRLSLIPSLFPGDVVVLDVVVRELLHESTPAVEAQRLRAFLANAASPSWEGKLDPSSSLSISDRSSLAWAIANRADWLLADERLLRRVAAEHGIAVVGFCGILVQSARVGLLTPAQVRFDIDTAISRDHLRISVQLYREILLALPKSLV
jgi:predicted nucleic acid-binding protein